MEKKLRTEAVTFTLKGNSDIKLHLLRENNNFSVNFDFYDSEYDALSTLNQFIDAAFISNHPTVIYLYSQPYKFDIVTDKFTVGLIAFRPWAINTAFFILDTFKGLSLAEIVKFIMDFCKSDCSKEFTSISFVSCYESKYYGYIFSKALIMKRSAYEVTELFCDSKLIDYMC